MNSFRKVELQKSLKQKTCHTNSSKKQPINQSFLVEPRKEEKIEMKLLFSLEFVETDCSGHQNKFKNVHPNINSLKKRGRE